MNPEYIELSNIEPSTGQSTPSPPTKSKNNAASSLTSKQIFQILVRLGVVGDDDLGSNFSLESIRIPPVAQFMIQKINDISVQEAIGILRETLAEHNGDVNFLHEDYMLIERLVHTTPRQPQSEAEGASSDSKSDPTQSDNPPENKRQNPFENAEDEEEEEDIKEELSSFISHAKHKNYLRITDWDLQVRLEASLIAYHSPYPEIRAITDPFDDPNIPVDTFRVYVIGLTWTFIGSIINNFFVHRMPAIRLSSHTIQLLLYPSGKLWEYCFRKDLMVRGVNINPGPWSYKEMMLCTIIYSCASGTPYSVYNIVVMKLDRFYGLKWVTWTFQILLALSTQCLGFGFAGIMRKVCIYPAKALWPTILPTIALNRALISQEESNSPIYGWRISRYSFFCVAFFGSFFYSWIPSFFFKALSNFNWPTWFSPQSLHLANITGSNTGLGLNPFPSLDWAILDSGACLTIPFYTYANQYLGGILGFFVIIFVYYTNNNWTGFLKINTNQLFNNKGEVFNVHDILNDKNQFDNDKYQQVGPPYFSAANLVSYGAYFCLYPFAILYHFVTEWESMKSSFRNTWNTLINKDEGDGIFGRDKDDPHCKMMSNYEEAPNWWFTCILLCSTCCALICVIMYPTETPIWGIFGTILINFVFLIPLTAIASVTGFSFGLNVLVELIVGYTIPNSGLALLTLKAFGYNIDHQASNYITDQKLAHYTKLPPRAIFKGQLMATMLNIVVALCVTNWQIANVEDFCDPHQKDKLTCPGDTTFFFSSVQYGVIGPAKVFGKLYPILKWCFLFGVLLVIPCAWFKKYGPKTLTRYFQPTLIIGGFLVYAPFNISYTTGGFYLSYIFMYKIKKNYLAWWEKYNYVLTSALSAGVAVSSLIMFFTVQYNHVTLDWWGNTVGQQGVEGGKGRLTMIPVESAPDGYFGLRKGNFP